MAWLYQHISILNAITNILRFGKGLEQSKASAEEVGEKLYKLKAMRMDLPAEVVGVMELLQRDEWATVLTPAQVSREL